MVADSKLNVNRKPPSLVWVNSENWCPHKKWGGTAKVGGTQKTGGAPTKTGGARAPPAP
jgi:hypothetical protein